MSSEPPYVGCYFFKRLLGLDGVSPYHAGQPADYFDAICFSADAAGAFGNFSARRDLGDRAGLEILRL
jgi:hypothetical protein